MNSDRIVAWCQAAQTAGVLPDHIRADDLPPLLGHSEVAARPWPLVLLMGLGAWVVAVPFVWLYFLLFEGQGLTSLALGSLSIGLALWLLRRASIDLFLEQLMLPLLIVGAVMLAVGLHRLGVAAHGWQFLLAFMFLGSAFAVPQKWLQELLGAIAACLLWLALVDRGWDWGWMVKDEYGKTRIWLMLHGLLGVAWLLDVFVPKLLRADALVRAAQRIRRGWLVVVLAGSAIWAGTTFLPGWEMHIGSAICAACGAAVVLRSWPAVRQAWCVLSALMIVGLAVFMPTLGACLLVLALCAVANDWKIVGHAALASVWIVGAFYYTLAWPLAVKGAVLMLSGLACAGLAVWGLKSWLLQAGSDTVVAPAAPPDHSVHKPSAQAWLRWMIALSVALVLVPVNFSIWQKERLLQHGRPIFVPIQPADPRSLMQGDYMALRFLSVDFLRGIDAQSDAQRKKPWGTFMEEPPRLVFQRDAHGIAHATARYNGQPLAANELVIALVRKNGQWVLVSDAFFFKEGEAQRWQNAQYGEFRVDTHGNALLVGLRGDKLQALCCGQP